MNQNEKKLFAIQSLLDMSMRVAEKIGTVLRGDFYTACRVPGPFFTWYDRCHLHAAPTEAELAALLQQVAEGQFPAKFCFPEGSMPDHVLNLLQQAGLVPGIGQTAMYLDLESWTPAHDCSAVELCPHEELEAWCLANSIAFGKPPETEPMLALQGDPALRLYAVRVGGEIVSAAASYITGSDCGIHEVATRSDFRRKGLCAAVMTRIFSDAKALGCKSATLQASPEGKLAYAALGMEDLGPVITWMPPIPH